MSFANLSAGWVLAGIAVLAGVLFALQRLRVRHREVTVVTTLFWQEAVQEARARVLVDRFRHPLAYLLVLLLAALVWIAAAEPRLDHGDDRDHVLLLDASAGMARDAWFETAKELLLADVEWAPRARTTVVLCGATPRTVLLPGENPLLLEQRLEDASPEACPETVTRTIRELVHASDDVTSLSVVVYGDGFFTAYRLTAQPAGLGLRCVPPTTRSGENHGITGLGVTDAASGAWGVVDVLVEATSYPGGVVPQPTATVDGTAVEAERSWAYRRTESERGARFVYRDVPANGGTFTVALPGGDALASDDSASRILPARSAIAVSATDDVPPALLAALRTDPAVRLVAPDAPADVVVTRDGRSDVPALVLVRESEQDDAIVVVSAASGDPSARLSAAYDDLALDQVDAPSLATTAGRPVRLGAMTGPAAQVRVWESLLTDRYDLIGQRAFPVFVARAVRRVAGIGDVPPVIAAGTSLPAELAPLREPSGARLDPADGALTPFVAGAHTTRTDAPLEVALLDARATAPHDAEQREETTARAAPPDLTAWTALAALALLCAEWVLFRRGRIP